MKLSWKLFFITTPLFILFLTLFGSWIIQETFQSSLEREIERGNVENQMFQNSYELTRHSLSDSQIAQTSVAKIVETFHRKSGSGDNVMRILDSNGQVLYQDGSFQVQHELLTLLDEEQNVGYELITEGTEVYLVILSLTSFGEFIETTRNISGVFTERAELYSQYQMGGLLLSVLVGFVILLVLFLVMRNIQKLSKATRQYARGNYHTKVQIRSRDEVGMLAEDFNWMADRMNQQMMRLQNEVRRQEEFTSAFAHELKTPLTSIIGYADTIRQMELSPEETDMCADYIYRQGKRLQALSYKLLEMTLADQQELEWKTVPVQELFSDVARAVSAALQEKQLKLRMQIQKGTIYGDRDLLGSLFINLIDNARKASEPGRTIYIMGEKLTEGYRVIVLDEGKGIPEEELNRITEAFYMVDKSRARRDGGAGLGLALCQKILDLHQGRWILENAQEAGLKVTIQFDERERE